MAFTNTLLNEIDIMRQLDHKHILKMLAFSFNIYSEINFIIYEHMNTNLIDLIKKNEINSIQSVVKIARQLTLALVYLSKKYIVHRDIRAKNIFVNNNLIVKLGNFNFAKKLDINNEYKIKSDIKEGIYQFLGSDYIALEFQFF
jgi:serine/threonine protein kinase